MWSTLFVAETVGAEASANKEYQRKSTSVGFTPIVNYL